MLEEVELVGEMEENQSKRPAGVPSSARTLSLEQLCQLVKSEFFIIVVFAIAFTSRGHRFRDDILISLDFQVHSLPSDNPCEVCF